MIKQNMPRTAPYLKDGDHEEANNNRPNSLLPILSKMCERTVLNQFMPYLVSNDRLTTMQSGNKRWHSTETTLIRSTDFILNAMDKRKITAFVLLDTSKAFNNVIHSLLLKKFQVVDVSCPALQWFDSYSCNRNQVVRIHSTLSDSLSVVNRIPQKSILGPILFNIYFNDLRKNGKIPQSCSTDCTNVNDTKLYMCFPCARPPISYS